MTREKEYTRKAKRMRSRTVLCRDYQIRADTIYLMDAGRYINQKHQRNVVDCRAIGFDEILIVEIR